MKILLDLSPLVVQQKSGIGNYIYNLTKKVLVNDKKNEYVLLFISPLDRINYAFKHEFNFYESVIKTVVLPLPSKIAIPLFKLWQLIEYPKIESLINKIDINIIHNHEWYIPPMNNSTKLVATVFDTTTYDHPEWHKKSNIYLQNTRLKRISNAEIIVTISQNSKLDIKKIPKLSKCRIEIIYPGVSEHIHIEKDKTKIEQVRRKYNLPKNFILFIGTNEPRKNLNNLIKAFNQVKDKIMDELVIVGGSGWLNNETTRLIKEDGIKIHLLNYIPNYDLNIILNQCKFLAYPSFYEGFGLPVLEALSVGKLVLTSNNSSLKEVGGEVAKYVDPHSINSIIKTLLELCDIANADKLYQESIEQAKKFSYEKSAKQLISIYNEI